MADTGAVDPSTGKKTLVGIYDRILTQRFPTAQKMTLYFRITNATGYYPLRIEFLKLGADEAKIAELMGQVDVSDRLAQVDFLVPTPALPFPEAGRYEFRLFASEMLVGSLRLDVSLYPETA